MMIIAPSVAVPKTQLAVDTLIRLERYARVCYKSEAKSSSEPARFLKGLLQKGHESVFEHEKCTVLFTVDRGVSHELVRHRIGSYSQESTRYCNYHKARFGHEIAVIEPFFLVGTNGYSIWRDACQKSEDAYMKLTGLGFSPQEARSVLPNSLKTEIVVTYNLREWRHFFNLRCSPEAHPQMRQVAIPLLLTFRNWLGPVFEDIPFDRSFPEQNYGKILFTDELFGNINE